MKRMLSLFLTVLLLWIQAPGASASSRKLTLMVYMCGSNLESGYGSASADIGEMLEAGISRDVTVLVMIGGSESWRLGYESTMCSIVEIGPRGQRRVWESDRMNMGDARTLTMLLNWGTENYPAEAYALILWDHGGGPVEGVCWDELFSLDHLSLPELTEAIGNAHLEKKLKWIGFDACLMSSLEVATALAPYAEYMIASQETEPAFGWNYAFLQGVENDVTGAETGRRAVDRYFEGHEETEEILTLACLDLSKTEEAGKAMDQFFLPLSEGIDESRFTQLAEVRLSTTGFGKSIRSTEETGYDLVDAMDLIQRLDGTSREYTNLAEVLEEMVVCSRSNEEDVFGVSLYHPYANKTQYLEKWGGDYARLGFSPGYTQYISSFGAVLTGEAMAEWKGLETKDLGGYRFGVQLSGEQAENFASAQLLILAGGFHTMGEIDNCVLVYSGPAVMNESGTVTGAWPLRTLYAEDQAGTLHGPLSFLLTDEGKYQVVTGVYTPVGRDILEDSTTVRYYLREEEGNDLPVVAQIRVWDEATGSFTNRLGFSETEYRQVNLWYYFRTLPEDMEMDPWPAYMDWPVNTNSFHQETLPLPQAWKFRYLDGFRSGEQYFAVIQITDAQQNVYCSRPVQVNNSNLTLLKPETDAEKAGQTEVRISAYLDQSPIDPGLQIFAEVTNCGETGKDLTLGEVKINDTRVTAGGGYPGTVEPGKTEGCRMDIPADQLLLLDTVRSISFTVRERDEDGTENSYPMRFAMQETSVSFEGTSDAIRGQTVSDGIIWELLGAETDEEDQVLLKMYMRNGSGAVINLPSWDVGINGLMFPAEWENKPGQLLPGEDTVIQARISNRSGVMSLFNSLQIKGDEKTLTDLIMAENLLQTEGETEILRLTMMEPASFMASMLFSSYREKQEIFLEPDMPIPFAFRSEGYTGKGLLLEENDQFELRIQRLLVGDNGVCFCLRAVNKMDEMALFEVTDLSINGIPASSSDWTNGDDIAFTVGAGMRKWYSGCVVLPESPEPGIEFDAVSFTIRINQEEESRFVTLRTKTPVRFGMTGGTMLEAEQLEER